MNEPLPEPSVVYDGGDMACGYTCLGLALLTGALTLNTIRKMPEEA